MSGDFELTVCVWRFWTDEKMVTDSQRVRGIKPVDDAETYQDFFNALEKSLFLTAHQVDWLKRID